MYPPSADIATAVVLPLLGVIAVCLRFWVRLRLQPSYVGLDDILIVFGSFFVCGMGAVQISSTVLGDFSQDTKVTPQRDYLEQKFNYINVVIEKPAYGAIKLSVLLFYRRVFSVRDRFRLFNNIMIVIIACWAIAFFWAEVFACGTDFTVQWKNRPTAAAHCTDHGTELLVFAVTDVIGDILIVIMPFFSIQQLKMTRREKWGVSFVFLLGTLSTVAAAMRLGFVAEAYSIGQMGWEPPAKAKPEPGGLRVINPALWTLVEVSMGVLAACLPPLGPIIRRAPTPSKIVSYTRRKLSLSSGPTERTNSDNNLMTPAYLEKGYGNGRGLRHKKSSNSSSRRSRQSDGNEDALPAVPPVSYQKEGSSREQM